MRFVNIYDSFFILSIILNGQHLFSQANYDYNWLMGYGPADSINNIGGSIIHFTNDSIEEITYTPLYAALEGNPSISDKEGKLMFYTNGCAIYNSDHSIVENGDSLNTPSSQWQSICYDKIGSYKYDQSIIILPLPNHDNIFYIFHLRSKNYFTYYEDYLYTVVQKENGNLQVIQKNVEIISDSLASGYVSAIRHGNGRDWWILLPVNRSEYFRRILLTDNGIIDTGRIMGPPKWDGLEYARAGQVCFSPDGSKYVRANQYYGVYIYPFDRCTGLLGVPVIIPPLNLTPDKLPAAMGVCFSPNSKYLYVSYRDSILQFDMETSNISKSGVKIAELDLTFKCPFYETSFFKMQLGPDNRIYCSGTNSSYCLHVISNPDAKGINCKFISNSIHLPALMYYALPTYPNYKLLDNHGSICDTLGINAVEDNSYKKNESFSIEIYPNPTINYLILESKLNESCMVTIQNLTGKIFYSIDLYSNEMHKVDSIDFPPGYYICTLRNNNGQIRTKSFVKM